MAEDLRTELDDLLATVAATEGRESGRFKIVQKVSAVSIRVGKSDAPESSPAPVFGMPAWYVELSPKQRAELDRFNTWSRCETCKSVNTRIGTGRPNGRVKLHCKDCGHKWDVADLPGRKRFTRGPRNKHKDPVKP